MTKNDIIKAMAFKTGYKQEVCTESLNAVFEIIKDSIKNGEKVLIAGFGTFDHVIRAPHIGRNPKTKEEISIPTQIACKFKLSKNFRDLLNPQ